MKKIISIIILFLVVLTPMFSQENVIGEIVNSDSPLLEKVLLIILSIGMLTVFTLIQILINNKTKKEADIVKSLDQNNNTLFVKVFNNFDDINDKLIESVRMNEEQTAQIKTISERIDKIEIAAGGVLNYETMKKYQNETNILLCKIVICNESLNIIDRLESFNKYISLGGNHSMVEYGMGLIIKNKDIWWNIQHKLGCESEKKEHIEYYNKVIEDIKTYLN